MLLFYVLVFWPQGMWNLSSPTRDQTHIACFGRRSLSHWTTRWVRLFFFSLIYLIFLRPRFFLTLIVLVVHSDGLIHPSPWWVTVSPWPGRPPYVYKILWSLVPSSALYFWSAFLSWFYNLLVLRALLTWGSAWIPSLSVTLESCFCLIISEKWAPSFHVDQNLLVSLIGMSYEQRPDITAAMTMGCLVKRVLYTLPSKPRHLWDWKGSLFTRMPGPQV